MQTKGFVYILTNPKYQTNCIKIGQTTDLEKRIKVLSSASSVPIPFEKYATLETVKYKEVEILIHKMIDGINSKVHFNKKREFFEIDPKKVLDMFYYIKPILEEDAEIKEYTSAITKKEQDQIKSKNKNFTFSSVGINIGETITFEPANIDVIVYSDTRIKYDNEVFSMSGFTKKFMPECKRHSSDSYQGPKFFLYKGTVLTELKKSKF